MPEISVENAQDSGNINTYYQRVVSVCRSILSFAALATLLLTISHPENIKANEQNANIPFPLVPILISDSEGQSLQSLPVSSTLEEFQPYAQMNREAAGVQAAYELNIRGQGIKIVYFDQGVMRQSLPEGSLIDEKSFIKDSEGNIRDIATLPKGHGTETMKVAESIATEAKFISMVVCDEAGCGGQSFFDAVEYLNKNHPDADIYVINYAGRRVGPDSVCDVIRALPKNKIVVIAAGNAGQPFIIINEYGDRVAFMPAGCEADQIIAVGAAESGTNEATAYSVYNLDSSNQYRIKSFADGSMYTFAPIYDDQGNITGMQIVKAAGTSISTPVVAAQIALYLSKLKSTGVDTSSITANQLEGIIQATGTKSINDKIGWRFNFNPAAGILNLFAPLIKR